MKQSMTRSYRLAKELSELFDLEGRLDTMLSVSMYHLNQFMDSERSSTWLFQHWNQKLTIFSSLDLELLNLAARLVAVAISNSRQYMEISVANEARRKSIKQTSGDIGKLFN
jgi:hypothetical protein